MREKEAASSPTLEKFDLQMGWCMFPSRKNQFLHHPPSKKSLYAQPFLAISRADGFFVIILEMPPENKVEETKPPQPEIKNPIKALRTYQGDVEETLGKKKVSKATILVAEQERRGFAPTEKMREVDTKTRNKIFIWSGIILFFLGVTAVGVVYYLKSINQVVQVSQNKTLIAFSEEKAILTSGLDRENFVKEILAKEGAFNMPLNSVLNLNSQKSDGVSLNAKEFLSLLAPQIPETLSRSFEDKYMLGIYSHAKNVPFIILTTNDFATSYSGMLSWEKNILSDLGPLFEINNTATTTAFSDETIQNKDLRVMKDINRKTVLVYSFIDKNTLVITGNEDVLTAIVGKYIISKQTR